MNATQTTTATKKVACMIAAFDTPRPRLDDQFPTLQEVAPKFKLIKAIHRIDGEQLPSIKAEYKTGRRFLERFEIDMPAGEHQRMIEAILTEAEIQRQNFSDDARTRYETMIKIADAIGANDEARRIITIPAFMQEHEPVPRAPAPETEQAETRIVDGRIVEDHSWTAEKAAAADAEPKDDRRHGGRTSGNPCDACGDASGETYWRGRRGWICGDCLDEGSSGYGYAW